MSPKILIVEDHLHNMRLMVQLLEDLEESVEPIKAFSGEEALMAARVESVRLVLMDISLPDIDGLQITKELRTYPHLTDTPFIAVTAHAMRGDEEAFRGVFDDFISKPIDADEFLNKLNDWLVKTR
ncbi:response regulator [Gorillibacterium sp. sgz5001074]|uniref:response regulator n=1 Tax=Gorillibacterium sp. sgz5001074 TaxID=3446695 RepID=UPI003F670C7C